MCGIVGYVGVHDAIPILIRGLQKLEYRGYDSAGVTFLENDRLRVIKKKGRIKILDETLQELGYNTSPEHAQEGRICLGMGHTRWATHGAPSDENAHPHLSDQRHVCVIHNGIIENHLELKTFLVERGAHFVSETDSEVVAHLIEYHYLTNCNADIFSAVQAALLEIEGSYALVVLCTEHPDLLIAAKKDNPLIIGYGSDANYVASDIPALIEYTRDVLIVEDNEIAIIRKDSVHLFTVHGQVVERDSFRVDWDAEAAEKGGFEHFMMKEIFEEPTAVKATISSRIRANRIVLDGFPLDREKILRAPRIHFVACGTAYHAGCVGKNIVEKLCRIPVEVDVASEFRYKDPIITEDSIVIIISQSGETIDTLAAMREAKRRGALTISIVNVVGSSIARESDYVLYTAAGPEISVASTKAYLTQLSCIYLVAFEMANLIGTITTTEYEYYIREMIRIPDMISQMLEKQSEIQKFASEHFNAKSIFFIGRGLDYFLSMEASLKLKEISYIHSEAYPGGELKHGTIALIEKGTLVVCSLTQDRLMEKMISNISEVKARGAVVLGITMEDKQNAIRSCDETFTIPVIDPLLAPMLAVTPCQLFAYYMAVNKGCDVDKPRNLAKSVTVE
ncbi:MAG: glutamine--fructose-6-phosphate transaminase (isomerizing) [Clostridiales bacterium]|nr:glutamine--fructose-6-phosphate transaminase (isomerizing) [Clostridiales bacterium]